MSDFSDDMEIGAALYEDYLEEQDSILEKEKTDDIYEYHTDRFNIKHRIANMEDSYLINCYKFFRKKFKYKRAFSFFIEIRLRYPNSWKEKIGE